MPVPAEEFEEIGRKRKAKNQIKSVLMQGPARVSEITENVDRSQSTVSKYLKEFKDIELVSKDNENRYYLKNNLEKDEKRLMENILDHGLGSEEKVSEAMNLTVNLKIKLKKLIELKYLSGSPESFSITDKALSKFDRTITGEKPDDQMVYHTVKSDGFSSYRSNIDPTLESPKQFLSYFQDSVDEIEICDHCGFPLDPDYIRKIILTDPENPEEEPSEHEKERCEKLIRELYGPVGSLLQMFRTYEEGEFRTTGKHYSTYRKNGEVMHPYCRKTVEKL